MIRILFSFLFFQLISCQFNTNAFGQFSNQDGNNPFGKSSQNNPFQQYGNQQSSYMRGNTYDYQTSPPHRGYNNELSVNPYMYNYHSSEYELKCPQHWEQYQQSCYRFIKSPMRAREDAKKNCEAYHSDLVSVNSLEEHGFLIYQLLWRDPQHRKWYTSIRQHNPGNWVNDGDGSPLLNMENAFLPSQDNNYGSDYLVYR